MTTLYCHSYSFVPSTGEDKTIDIAFDTDDDLPHRSQTIYPPYHLIRSGEESVEVLIRTLRFALDREFANYITLAPKITTHLYTIQKSDNLNVSAFTDVDTGMNVVSTILVSGEPVTQLSQPY